MNTERERLLDEVVTAYLKAIEAGETPNRDEILARHPELAVDLGAFFAAESQVGRVAAPLRAPKADESTTGLSESASAAPGTRVEYFGDYQLLAEVGRGGMGVVYKARQETLNRTVALKMILSGRLATEADVRRFRAEAEAAARLDHHGIVTVYEVGQHEGQHYFSMAFVEGESLAHRLAQGLLAPREAADLTRKVAEAVAYAHVEGVVHRDLKPANILIDKNGQPRLTDFGLAKRVEGDSGLTATGQILGTPSYMPPEQASGCGDAVGPLSDVYSLGAILYCLLTGRPPFQADNPLDTLMQVLQRDPVPPRQLNAAIPRDLETICLKCLEKDPRKRYPSAQELTADLGRFLGGLPIRARPVTQAERTVKWVKRNKFVAGATATVFLALVTGTGASLAFGLEAQKQEGIAQSKANDADREAQEANRQRGIADASAAAARRQEVIAATEARRATDAANLLAAQLKETRRLLDLSKLRTAQLAFDNNLVQLARDTLADIAPENRCLVWGLLNRRFEGSLFALYEHSGVVASVAVSADGSRIVTGSRAGTARVWEARMGQPLLELKGHMGAVAGVALSADSSRIVTGSFDKTARVWDARTGQLLLELRGHSGAVCSVAVSADGSRIVTGALDKTARLWDGKTGRFLFELKGHSAGVWSVWIEPDGFRVVTGSQDQTARVWDGRTGQSLLELKGHALEVTSVGVSADGSRIVTGSGDKTIRVWDGRTGHPLSELKGHTALVWSACVSADGSRIVTGSWDASVRVWDGRGKQPFTELKGHRGMVNSVAFSADGSRIVTGSGDGVRVWDARTGLSPLAFNPPTGVTGVTVSPDGSLIVTGSGDTVARVWDARSGQLRHELKGHAHQVSSAAVTADNLLLVTGSLDGTARVWDAQTGRCLLELKGHTNGVRDVAVSPDGSRIVTGAWDKTARVWAGHTGQLILELKGHTSGVKSVALSADGSRIVTGSDDRTACVWDARSGQRRLELKGHTGQVTGVAVSPDGSRIVTGSQDETVRVWDAQTGQSLLELKGPGHQVLSVAVAPDGSRLVTGSWDGVARVWDARTDQPLEFKGHTDQVNSLAVSSDGSLIATGSDDGTARVWDARTGRSLTELKGHTLPVTSVAVSADGSRIVTGSSDKTVRVWAATGQSLLELKGHTSWVRSVAVSANGSQIVSADGSETRFVWDAAIGNRLPDAPVPPLAPNRNRTPDGGYQFVPSGDRVLRMPTRLDEVERLRRLWLTRPDPDWHLQRQKELTAEGNSYGATLHRTFAQSARGVLALEVGDFDRAWGHFIVASALKPVPSHTEVVPSPAMIPPSK
jgi:WD40 repeat protein/tRNA A-37 threonylcarbamoyl transferase component Bud32